MKRTIIILLSVFLLCGGVPAWASKKQKKDPDGKPAVGSIPQLIDAKRAEITGNTEKAEELFRSYTEKFPDDAVGHFELARILIDKQNVSEAQKHAALAAELDPDNTWYQMYLAEIEQVQGHFKESIAIYEKLAERYPDNDEYLYQLGSIYIAAEKYRDAIRTYDRIEEKSGISEDISLQKQKIYIALNDADGAVKELEKLVAAYPDNAKYLSILAEYYMANKNQEKALGLYRKIAEVDPGNPYIHMSMADYYRKSGDKARSFEELKLGFANPNLDIDTKINILLTFYSANQTFTENRDEIYVLVKILTETHPNDPKSHSIYGDLLYQDKKYPEAREEFLRVVALDSSKYVVWEEVLRLDLQTDNYQHLVDFGKKATELYPEQPVAMLFTGIGAFQLKQYDEAVRYFLQGSKLVVRNDELLAQFYMYLGDTYHAMEKPSESDQYYQKSLDLKGDNAYVLNNYAYYLSVRNIHLEKAETMAKKAVALDTANGSFMDTYGWVLYRLGKFEEARKWIEKALKDKEESSAEVLEHYGDVLYRLGDPAGALDYWKKAKEKGQGSSFLERKITEKKLYE